MQLRSLIAVISTLVLISGCGQDELNSPAAVRLRGLATCYLDYAVSKNGGGPSSEQVLKKHMRNLPDFILEMNGLDAKDIDAAFVSPRDNEPFVVLYGTGISAIGGPSTPLVAHEKTGVNKKRLIAFADARVELVDEERFTELTSAKP